MLFFKKRKDGGPESNVMGYWLIEIKPLFSIVLLRFDRQSRENYHSHAFNALTWFIKGKAVEDRITNDTDPPGIISTWYKRSLIPKFTPRNNIHKVHSLGVSWALSIRGPWKKTWVEYNYLTNTYTTLTHGRKEIL